MEALWNIGTQRKKSYGILSYAFISQENENEVRPLGKNPGGKRMHGSHAPDSLTHSKLHLAIVLDWNISTNTEINTKRNGPFLPYCTYINRHAGLFGFSLAGSCLARQQSSP